MTVRRIVLLGIGHTNADFVRRWMDHPLPDVELVCVSKFDQATYSGMLPGTLGGQFRPDQMQIDLRRLVDDAGGSLVVGNVVAMDAIAKELQLDGGDRLRYDVLSIGVGSIPAGCENYTDVSGFVPIKPMQTFLSRLHRALDLDRAARTPSIAIVGGGVASVEIAFCLDQWIRLRSSQSSAQLQIFCADEHVASGMSRQSVKRLEVLLANRGINVVANARVTNVQTGKVVVNDESPFDADIVVWATGAAPPHVIRSLGLPTDSRGFIATQKTLQSTGDPAVFAVGDCGTVVDSPHPKAGVYAVRQSPVLWHNIRAFLGGHTLKEFQPQNDFLKLLNTGDGKAMLEYRGWTIHSRWCLWLKNRIDRGFIRQFQR
ncbi:NADH dehydrogenase [Crateriforma conspicua]|uniref:NADH dehydrogenase n=1 Tax=Crateriforma conspicua TaxID=2527996 RepID=A0A5C6FRB6_9PLAN|nr:FAD-dependent oxidoreductase [Crateriforma conspicua]TWU65449.1 NADH dehydrogenase [Crateriforma conspicua]